METVLLAIVVLLVLVAAMSIGVIMGRKPIKGSCGGVGAALGETEYICPMCGDDPAKCDEKQSDLAANENAQELSYEAGSSRS